MLWDEVISDLCTWAMKDMYMDVSGNLKNLHDDKYGMWKEKFNAISGPDEFSEYYNMLKQKEKIHWKQPNEICVAMSVESE